jgi:hypothetical protein
MRNTSEITVTQTKINSITCDVCGTTYDDVFEMQEFFCFSITAGYGSIFGDMNQVELDMCQHCTKLKLGEHLRITEFEYPEFTDSWDEDNQPTELMGN